MHLTTLKNDSEVLLKSNREDTLKIKIKSTMICIITFETKLIVNVL